MNGPEHYREAERLAEYAASPAAFHAGDAATSAQIAQAHATLALAAATVEPVVQEAGGDPEPIITAWSQAIS